jgi:hypothetical protein
MKAVSQEHEDELKYLDLVDAEDDPRSYTLQAKPMAWGDRLGLAIVVLALLLLSGAFFLGIRDEIRGLVNLFR